MVASHQVITKWPLASRIFHWISALLLLVTWGFFLLYENSENVSYLNLHKAFGLSLLCWMIARLLNRLMVKAPPRLTVPNWQDKVAHLTHFALYALLIAMPIVGFLMVTYGGRPVSVFGLFEIPVLVTPDRSMARFFNNLHTNVIWTLILGFTGLHIVAALYHQFFKKDKLINRMM